MVHEVRMEEEVEDDVKFSPQMFDETMRILRKKAGEKYRFILKGGKSLHNALYKL